MASGSGREMERPLGFVGIDMSVQSLPGRARVVQAGSMAKLVVVDGVFPS
jgi:hypothetical protein